MTPVALCLCEPPKFWKIFFTMCFDPIKMGGQRNECVDYFLLILVHKSQCHHFVCCFQKSKYQCYLFGQGSVLDIFLLNCSTQHYFLVSISKRKHFLQILGSWAFLVINFFRSFQKIQFLTEKSPKNPGRKYTCKNPKKIKSCQSMLFSVIKYIQKQKLAEV